MKANQLQRALDRSVPARAVAWAIVAAARVIGDFPALKRDPVRAVKAGFRARWIALEAVRQVWGQRALEGLAATWTQGRYSSAAMLRMQRRQSWWNEDLVAEIAHGLTYGKWV